MQFSIYFLIADDQTVVISVVQFAIYQKQELFWSVAEPLEQLLLSETKKGFVENSNCV